MRTAYEKAVTLWRDHSPRGRHVARVRAETDRLLDSLARSAPPRFEGTVLVDGMWDNPNFWLRYSLLRAALGLAHGREIGLLGPFRQRHCRGTFARLGIDEVHSFPDLPAGPACDALARSLVKSTRDPQDILAWDLPGGMHPAIVYDGILKRQRRAAVDVGHPLFLAHVTEALRAVERNRALLDRTRPDLVILSHPINFAWGSLAWLALSRGIPVVLAFGLFGVLRFCRMRTHSDLFAFYDRPSGAEIDSLAPAKADLLATEGRRYLAGRFDGRADDLAAVFAFQRRHGSIERAQLCERFGWDPGKPIVAFYASNWFDWPHQLGMTQFRDFLDWTEATFRAARANGQVNWLFKPHPAEEWFGGVGLVDILNRLGQVPHIAIADRDWNNGPVMKAVDALVTYHGTAGIEFAALGKPVLVPDRGKYEDCGFVKLARSRQDYVDLLASEWWSDMDLDDARRRAEIFAGLWFCAPDWQGEFVLADDSGQEALYSSIPGLLQNNAETVRLEIASIREWWQSGHPYYHTGKMLKADRFRLTNLR
jgi:hypothetical protein